jgi:CheY-like chemotaxis protein
MSKNVLIVEDDKDIREPMRELLEEEGYEVACASTGREALTYLQSSPTIPGVILCDLMMPNMNGVELIEILRVEKNEALKAIVILSAAAHAEKTATSLGVGFLKKPIDIEYLLETVSRYCV